MIVWRTGSDFDCVSITRVEHRMLLCISICAFNWHVLDICGGNSDAYDATTAQAESA